MSTSLDIAIDTAKSPVVATGVSEQMRAVNIDTSASSVLDEPKLAGDGSDTQIQSKPGAATAAATAKVPAVGAAASEESAPLAAAVATGKEGPPEDMAALKAEKARLEAEIARLEAIGTSSLGWRAPSTVQLEVLCSFCCLCTSAPLLEQNLKALSLFAPTDNHADECCLLYTPVATRTYDIGDAVTTIVTAVTNGALYDERTGKCDPCIAGSGSSVLESETKARAAVSKLMKVMTIVQMTYSLAVKLLAEAQLAIDPLQLHPILQCHAAAFFRSFFFSQG